MNANKRIYLLIGVMAILAIIALSPARHVVSRLTHRANGMHTLEQRIEQYGAAARGRLKPDFARARVDYPPEKLVLVGLKQERVLQVYAAGNDGEWRCVKSYPILAASGEFGPKLNYGDCQVPEGIYRVVFLNPNSSYHLSLRLDYPNDFDRAMAERDGRTDLGGDIMIHGSDCSVGCLAMGDEAAEDLFVLAADTGMANIKVILSPVDFRTCSPPDDGGKRPSWTPALYRSIRRELRTLPPSP